MTDQSAGRSIGSAGSSTTSVSMQTPIDALTASIDALDPPSSTTTAESINSPSYQDSSTSAVRFDPPIRIIIREADVHPDLAQGLAQLARSSVRNNLEWVPIDEPVAQHPQANSHLWFIQIAHDPTLPSQHLSIRPSHSDFTDLSTHLPSSSLPSSHFTIAIRYRRSCEAFRGLGHVLALTRHCSVLVDDPGGASSPNGLGTAHNGDEQVHEPAKFEWTGDTSGLEREETCLFETTGPMIDCSRNGVLLVEKVEEWLRMLALMGCNMLQLYTEDTYQIPGESFFGYFRGPYTEAELRRIDDYAFALGIEIIPCIQTLGHLGQMLQWPRYGGYRDTHEVLLAGSEEVYGFIEKMLRASTGPLRTNRVHLGMDEAHGVGEGRYRQVFGHRDSTQVFTDHLKRVNEICNRMGLKPMIWSDMLFCLAAKNNSLGGYYGAANPATPELVDAIPDDIELVYWDYYHTTHQPYANKAQQHWELARKPPWMASGVWTWSRFWTALPFTFETVRACMKASKSSTLGIRNAITTIWGDEGNECDMWSGLPGILYFAEHCYTPNDEVDVALLKRKFDGIAGGCWDDFVYASKLDDLQPESQPVDNKSHFTPNMSKWLLWEDPFYSIFSPQYAGHDLETHYSSLAAYLEFATATEPSSLNPAMPPQSVIDVPLNSRLALPKLLARILAAKCHLRDRLVFAYRNRDREELEALAGPSHSSRMWRLRTLVDEMWRYHMRLWMSSYKPFGWEVLELRYGGLRSRLETMHTRLMAFLDDTDTSVTRIEELEVQTETVYNGLGTMVLLDYHRASRATYC